MIHKFKFENFASFRNEAEVSFLVTKRPLESFYDAVSPGRLRTNKVVGVVGPNGSGKTQLLKPLAFLSWFVEESFFKTEPEEEILVESHVMARDELTSFDIEFSQNESVYRYRLKLNSQAVFHESLYIKTSSQFSYIFVRDLVDSDSGRYEVKQKGLGLEKAQAEKARKNVSLISTASSYGSEVALQIVLFFSRVIYNVTFSGRSNYELSDLFLAGKFFHEDRELATEMRRLICEFDLGLSDVEIEVFENLEKTGEKEDLYLPQGVHLNSEGTFVLPFFSESNGTQSLFILLSKILPVLRDGGVAVLDELDNDLHPLMLPAILDLFKHRETNPNDAQLIFSCHTPEIFSLLAKHQIYLVEKSEQASESWRLDSVQGLRVDDNLYAKYMSGALDAVPGI